METKPKCIMLVDDNPDDNFFHEREIKKNNVNHLVIIKNSGLAALEYLKSKTSNKDPHPDLIFLDINMPGMNGWQFLKEYNQLGKELQSKAIVIMLTTSDNENDITESKKWNFVSDYKTKPLTKTIVKAIVEHYFED
jgi:CheY-like chemotaxis protein